MFALMVTVTGLPLASLVRTAGFAGGAWHGSKLLESVHYAWNAHRGQIVRSLLQSLFTGAAAASLALVTGWLVRGSRAGTSLVAGLGVIMWTLPGPVIGLALKASIDAILSVEEAVGGPGWLRAALYDGPSPVPVAWAALMRTLPVALAVLLPAIRAIPTSLTDMARTDGASAMHLLRLVIWPGTRRSWVVATLAVTALSLGELSAGKLVYTFKSETFAQEVFMQMHYGISNHLAAMCLILLALVAVPLVTIGCLERDHRVS
jgi:ABC-type Fe3+ transport system permease subunit